MSRLRWLMQEQGVRLLNEENETTFTMYTMGVKDKDGNHLGRLLGIWVRGNPRTLLMAMCKEEMVEPLHVDDAEKIIEAYRLENESEIRMRSNGFLA